MKARALALPALPAFAAWLAMAALAACSGPEGPAPPPLRTTSLGPGEVARVGETTIGGDLVADVASARSVPPRAALELLLSDALAAEGATARGLAARADVAWAETSARGRLFAKRANDAARAAGPPTDAEVATLTAEHWKDVALPEQVRVAHALIMVPKGADDAAYARARPMAESMRKALASAQTESDFEAAAKAADHPGFELRVETLPPFVADGRVSVPGDDRKMDPGFAAAAFALDASGGPAATGATSGLVKTPFGWHVIRLLERLPPHEVSLEERRTLFTEEAYVLRARAAHDAALAAQRAKTRVEVSPAARAILDELPASPP